MAAKNSGETISIPLDLERIHAENAQRRAEKRHYYVRLRALGLTPYRAAKYARRAVNGAFVTAFLQELQASMDDMMDFAVRGRLL